MEKETSEELRWRFIARFLDVLILGALREKPMSGYDFMGLTSKKFYVNISPGIIYSTLYSMERKGLIKGESRKRKRVYTLTPKGKETRDTILKTKKEIVYSLEGIFERMV
jgi:DNA-binding PadR family transcriptional regulator